MISLHSYTTRLLYSTSQISSILVNRSYINSQQKYVFSSTIKKDQLPTCIERRKMINHFKNIFQQNINLFTEICPEASVSTNAQILSNMHYLAIDNSNLSRVIKETFAKKLESEINPKIALNVLYAICTQYEGDEVRLLKQLTDYFREFFYLFDYEDLRSVEYILMQSGKHLPLQFDASLENEVDFKKHKLKQLNYQHTKQMIDKMKISMPKGANVIFSKDDNKIQINFSDIQQNLIIYGIDQGDYKSILLMKELLQKDKSTRHFILESPPLTYTQLADTMDELDTNREQKLKSMMFGGSTYAGSADRSESIEPDQLLKHYGQIPVLSGDMIRFYINTYLLKQKSQYRLNDVERIIYTQEDGLARPDEQATFIYNQMTRDKQHSCKILLADLNIEDEIYHQITNKTDEQIQTQFNKFKIINLNEQINWAIKVGKSGCPTCTQGVKKGPNNMLNVSGETDYDFTIKQRHLAQQAMHFMKVNKDADKFIMFVNNGNLMNVLKEVLRLYDANEFKSNSKQVTKYQDYIEEFQKISMKSNFQSYDSDLSFLNKFSLYSSYFKTNRLLLPKELRNSQNLKDYEYLRSNYLQQLHPDSFINPSQKWVKQKGQEKCFALKLLKFA